MRSVFKEGREEMVLTKEAGTGWCKGPEAALSLLDGGDGVERQAGRIRSDPTRFRKTAGCPVETRL